MPSCAVGLEPSRAACRKDSLGWFPPLFILVCAQVQRHREMLLTFHVQHHLLELFGRTDDTDTMAQALFAVLELVRDAPALLIDHKKVLLAAINVVLLQGRASVSGAQRVYLEKIHGLIKQANAEHVTALRIANKQKRLLERQQAKELALGDESVATSTLIGANAGSAGAVRRSQSLTTFNKQRLALDSGSSCLADEEDLIDEGVRLDRSQFESPRRTSSVKADSSVVYAKGLAAYLSSDMLTRYETLFMLECCALHLLHRRWVGRRCAFISSFC